MTHKAKTYISIFSGANAMKNSSKLLRMMAVLFIVFLSLASVANSQMNRDSPLLGSKLPRTADESILNKGQMSGSSFVISEPDNGQSTSDLTLSSDQQNTTCNQVSFRLTLTPSSRDCTGYQRVIVRVLERVAGSPQAVAELILLMPASGGSVHETIAFPGEVVAAGQNRTSQITVVVDPDNEVRETNEANNAQTVSGTCRAWK